MRSSGPLQQVRVIDMTNVFMGPSATQHLGDLGADVIKVESPEGDSTRTIGPCGDEKLGPLYLGLNRNKRSIVLDLKKPAGREALIRLIKDADVLVYNIRPKAMERLGLSYKAVSEVNPKIIYVGALGFSQRGRYAANAAFDDLIQAAVALPTLVAEAGGGSPRYLPITIADRSVGLYLFGIISTALYSRCQSGRGQRVDVPMFETMIPSVLGDHLFGQTFIPSKGNFGYQRLLSLERRPYRTRDGYVSCTVYRDKHWKSFLALIGKPELYESDPRFADLSSRTVHVDELYRMVGEELRKRTTSEWIGQLSAADIPVFPVNSLETLLDDSHLNDIQFFSEVVHPVVGKIRQTAVPSEWSETIPTNHRHAPSLGEHSAEILLEAGYSDAEIAELQSSAVTNK